MSTNTPPATFNGMLVLGSSAALIISAIIIFLVAGQGSTDSTLLFIGFLLASLVGLALAAAIYNGLGHDTSNADAFGLPNGSIRALLAIAIMVLFVIFGLPFIRLDGAPSRMADEAFETVTVPCSAVGAELQRYRGNEIVAIPDYQSCAVPPQVASLKLYRRTREYSENQLELGKQILTAVITLLTTIIGFYFGSQSAMAAASAAAQGRLTPSPATGGGGGGDDKPDGGPDQTGRRTGQEFEGAPATEAEAARIAAEAAKAGNDLDDYPFDDKTETTAAAQPCNDADSKEAVACESEARPVDHAEAPPQTAPSAAPRAGAPSAESNARMSLAKELYQRLKSTKASAGSRSES